MGGLESGRDAADTSKARTTRRGKRSGSETRKPSKIIHVRYPLEEFARLEEEAERAGLTLSAHVRAKTNQIKPKRSNRRRAPQQRIAAHYLAQLGKIGSNLNQLARTANMNQAGSAELDSALKETREFKALLQRILRSGR